MVLIARARVCVCMCVCMCCCVCVCVLMVWHARVRVFGRGRVRVAHARRLRRARLAVLLVYDTLSAASLGSVDAWMADIARNCPPGVIVSLLGNKVDDPARRAAGAAAAEDAVATRHGIKRTDVSAKTGYNIDAAFAALLTALQARGNRV